MRPIRPNGDSGPNGPLYKGPLYYDYVLSKVLIKAHFNRDCGIEKTYSVYFYLFEIGRFHCHNPRPWVLASLQLLKSTQFRRSMFFLISTFMVEVAVLEDLSVHYCPRLTAGPMARCIICLI